MRRYLVTPFLAAAMILACQPPGTPIGRGQEPEPPAPAPPEPTPGPPSLSIQGETDLPAYSLARLTLDGGPVADAEWDVLYAADISRVVDGEETDALGTRYVFTGPPGSYRVTAWASADGKMIKASTTVTFAADTPPTPTPGPEPRPEPTPEPPAPDPLAQALDAAYRTETASDKAVSVASLTLFYRFAATAAENATLRTWGDLFDTMSQTAQAIGVAGKVPTVQRAIQSQALAKLPTSRAQSLDDAGRKLAAETFRTVADALSRVEL